MDGELKPIIVGLYSSAPGSGKSTLAGYLERRGFVVLPFARPLKVMVRALLDAVLVGVDGPSVGYYVGPAGKNELIPELGTSVRELSQKLGTEWGREHFGEDFWVRIWSAAARQYLATPGVAGVVADDMRFFNEYQRIHELGGVLVRIARPDLQVDQTITAHASEGQLDKMPFDLNLVNTSLGSLETAASYIADGRVRRSEKWVDAPLSKAELYPQRQME